MTATAVPDWFIQFDHGMYFYVAPAFLGVFTVFVLWIVYQAIFGKKP